MQRIADIIIEQATRIATDKASPMLSMREFLNEHLMLANQRSVFNRVNQWAHSYLHPAIIRYSLRLPQDVAQQQRIIDLQAKMYSSEHLDAMAGMLSVGPDASLIGRAFAQWQHVANVLFFEDNSNPELIFYKFRLDARVKQGCEPHSKTRYLRGFVENINGTGYIAFNADYFEQCELKGLIPRKYKTVLHEIGHIVFGFTHPFHHKCISQEQIATSYSVMNYEIKIDLDGRAILPTSPMLADIVGAQYRLGANRTAAMGDTTYHLSDYVVHPSRPYKPITAIWDSSGIDTFNAAHLRSPKTVIDLRPWSRSDLGNGYVTLGDVEIENVVAGRYSSTIILNALNNDVGLRYAKAPVTIVIDSMQCGHDVIKKFDVRKDVIYLEKGNTLVSPVCKLKRDGLDTIIKFDDSNTLRLTKVKLEDLRQENIVSGATLDVVECEIFSEYPLQFYADFSSAFKRGAVVSFLTGLTEESLRAYRCSERQIYFVMQVAQSLLILLSGSWLSSMASCVSSALLRHVGLSSKYSSMVGMVVAEIVSALQEDFSIAGLAKVPARSMGSIVGCVTGASLVQFGLWAHRKILLQPVDVVAKPTYQ